MHATALIARKYELAAARGLAYEAQDLQRALQRAVNDSVRAFRDLHESGVDPAFIVEMLKVLHDAASNADHALRVTMDEASIHAEHIDLSEVRELIEKVRGEVPPLRVGENCGDRSAP